MEGADTGVGDEDVDSTESGEGGGYDLGEQSERSVQSE